MTEESASDARNQRNKQDENPVGRNPESDQFGKFSTCTLRSKRTRDDLISGPLRKQARNDDNKDQKDG